MNFSVRFCPPRPKPITVVDKATCAVVVDGNHVLALFVNEKLAREYVKWIGEHYPSLITDYSVAMLVD